MNLWPPHSVQQDNGTRSILILRERGTLRREKERKNEKNIIILQFTKWNSIKLGGRQQKKAKSGARGGKCVTIKQLHSQWRLPKKNSSYWNTLTWGREREFSIIDRSQKIFPACLLVGELMFEFPIAPRPRRRFSKQNGEKISLLAFFFAALRRLSSQLERKREKYKWDDERERRKK